MDREELIEDLQEINKNIKQGKKISIYNMPERRKCRSNY